MTYTRGRYPGGTWSEVWDCAEPVVGEFSSELIARVCLASALAPGEVARWVLSDMPPHRIAGPIWIFSHDLPREFLAEVLPDDDNPLTGRVQKQLQRASGGCSRAVRWLSVVLAPGSRWRRLLPSPPGAHFCHLEPARQLVPSVSQIRYVELWDLHAEGSWATLESLRRAYEWREVGERCWEILGDDLAAWRLMFDLAADGMSLRESLGAAEATRV